MSNYPPGVTGYEDYFGDTSGDELMREAERNEIEHAAAADERWQALKDLRGMIDWFEAHPDVPLPTDWNAGNSIGIYALNSKEEAERLAKQFGSCTKEWNETFLYLKKKFGSLTLNAVFSRNQVCERVVVGTEEIPETVIPERVEPAHVVEKVEWRCSALLASERPEEEAT